MAIRHTPRKWLAAVVWTGFLAAGLAGCGEQAQPVTSETTKFRPADGGAPAAASGDVAAGAPGAGLPTGAGGSAEFAASNGAGAVAAEGGAGQAAAVGSGDAKSPAADGKAPPAASGELQQLLAQMDRLSQQQPKGKTQQEQIEDFVRNQQQRLAIGTKALTMKPDKETKQRIVEAMYEIYRVFVDQLRAPGAREQLTAFSKSLAAEADPDLKRMGQHMLFEANVSRIANEQAGDGKDILAELKKLLDGEQGALHPLTLDLGGQAVKALLQLDMKDDAVAAQEMIAAAVAADPKLAAQAGQYADRAKLVKADLSSLLEDVLTKRVDQTDKLMAAVNALMADVKLTAEVFVNMQQVAQILEVTGHYADALKVYELLAGAAKTTTEEKLVKAATHSAESARKRLVLVGQPLAVEGVLLDGRPFDWSAYQGKIVLLDFWATWCGPCIEELPNIRRNFEQFHAKGFEVIGINLDTEVNDVKQFLSLQELPWVTISSQVVLDGKAGKDFSQLPMAAKCGVDAIPFVVLIGKDGNVDSIHVRGPKLEARLTQLLGAPAAAEVPADPTQPGAKGAAPAGKAPAAAEPALRPATGDRGDHRIPRGAASPVAVLVMQALLAAEPAAEPASGPAGEAAEANPYRAKTGLKVGELMGYIEKMLDKPQAIQVREGFAAAIVEACDRVLAAGSGAQESEWLTAAETKLAMLHREAGNDKKMADEQIRAFVEQLKDDARPRIAAEVKFHRLEQRVLAAGEMPLADVPALLKDVQEFVAQEKLSAKHVRLASKTVAAINRLESGDEREKHFADIGGILAKSSDKELARYGRKLAKGAGEAEAIRPAAAIVLPK